VSRSATLGSRALATSGSGALIRHQSLASRKLRESDRYDTDDARRVWRLAIMNCRLRTLIVDELDELEDSDGYVRMEVGTEGLTVDHCTSS
jgi:hypothetical protein